jgi:hypothetical protein
MAAVKVPAGLMGGSVAVAVGVGVAVAGGLVGVAVGVGVGVRVSPGLRVGVGVGVAVGGVVGVAVAGDVGVAVAVGGRVGVAVGVEVAAGPQATATTTRATKTKPKMPLLLVNQERTISPSFSAQKGGPSRLTAFTQNAQGSAALPNLLIYSTLPQASQY